MAKLAKKRRIFVLLLSYYSVCTTKTKRTQREKGDNPSKRGSSLDQTQSSEFAGQKEEGENHPVPLLSLSYLYKSQTGDEPQTQDTQANIYR